MPRGALLGWAHAVRRASARQRAPVWQRAQQRAPRRPGPLEPLEQEPPAVPGLRARWASRQEQMRLAPRWAPTRVRRHRVVRRRRRLRRSRRTHCQPSNRTSTPPPPTPEMSAGRSNRSRHRRVPSYCQKGTVETTETPVGAACERVYTTTRKTSSRDVMPIFALENPSSLSVSIPSSIAARISSSADAFSTVSLSRFSDIFMTSWIPMRPL